MKTPICDFVRDYAESDSIRLHMPGHKGKSFLGMESLDITEISGADSLYNAEGIISESEENASRLFGCKTLYSTEGSSQCIRAMLYLISVYAKSCGKKPLILAGRNAHKTFISGAALLDFDVRWIYPETNESYLSCKVNAEKLDSILSDLSEKPVAVYLTNPDYLGNFVDIKSIASVCHKHNALLAVDNAHGAYLRFLSVSQHPVDLGADICCDSAHKTLPVLTGGAYLHISDVAPVIFKELSKNALAFFGSTSPSYIILQSLDMANKYISDGYNNKLEKIVKAVSKLKNELTIHGYSFIGDEPLKLTFNIKKYGYTGLEFAEILKKQNVICEFSDPDFLVMMFTPEIAEESLERLKNILVSIPVRDVIDSQSPLFRPSESILSLKDAVFSDCETVPVSESVGRVLAISNVSCPPAVPIVISGERIDNHSKDCFEYYGIKFCTVVK